MTDDITFFVPGRPFSKKRARSGRGVIYTPPETVAAENSVRFYARRAWGDQRPFEGPVGLTCHFAFERARTSKVPQDVKWHVGHIDGDNLLKLVSDALNPHKDWHGAWKDDCQVALFSGSKTWTSAGEPEGTTITVSRLPE